MSVIEKKSLVLLQTVNDLCKDGTYKILSIEDLINNLPKKVKMNDEEIRTTIEDLAKKQLVSIKYSDEHEFCLAPLPDGKMKCDNSSYEEEPPKKLSKRYLVTSFFGSFLGGLVGGVIVYIIVKFLEL